MRTLNCILILFCLFLYTNACFAQGNIGYSRMDDTNTSVVIHADARLAALVTKKQHKSNPVGYISSGAGFRVQIYNGNDRKAAINMKVDFMRRYPTMHTYMTYVAPHFRVKVGDFRRKEDALKFNHEIIAFYTPTMIVPDIIVINSIQDD